MAAYTSTGLADLSAATPALNRADVVGESSAFVEVEGGVEEAARSALLVHPAATAGVVTLDETERIP